MKRNAVTLLAGSILAIGLLTTFTGCSTGGVAPSVTPARMAMVAELAAYEGTTIYLAQHTNDRPAFVAAQASLALLAAGTNATPADVTKALQSLPIKELKSTQGQVAIGAAVILYDAFLREHVSIDANGNTWLKPVIEGLNRGFTRALAVPQ